MSTRRKVILLAAAICYAVIIYGYLTTETTLMMVLTMVYGVLMLVFVLTGDGEKKENRVQEKETAGETAVEQAVKTDVLEKRIRELTEEKERYSRALEEAAAAREKAEEAAAAKEEPTADRQEPADRQKELLAGLLPPAEKEEKETIDIVSVARETARELQPFAEKVQLEIRISAPEEKILVNADSARLRILFRNVIDNSIKYMNRAGVLVITLSNLGDDIFIVLKDNGNGLSEKETAHIFELNYQGSNRISGNGLGLTQAKAIVEYYGGTIYAKSNFGKGMGIYIQLPTD